MAKDDNVADAIAVADTFIALNHHVLSYSGGKDSTAMALLSLELGEKHGFEPIIAFADTGNEHALTYEYVEKVEAHIGIPIRRVKQDFTADMERKRAYIAEHWEADGVPAAQVARALELLYPTGIPYLDLCMMKGRFPARRSQFCTEFLKALPMMEQVQLPLMKTGRVLSWHGIRAEESAKRAGDPRFERGDFRLWIWRPILAWTVDDVFAIHRRHGLEPNPLYKLGMARVGCMPCINVNKRELREIGERFPDEVARVAEWELLVAAVSKRGAAAFFAVNKTPGPHTKDHSLPMPDINEVMRWAKTGKGGRNFDLENWIEDSDQRPACSSVYGLCE